MKGLTCILPQLQSDACFLLRVVHINNFTIVTVFREQREREKQQKLEQEKEEKRRRQQEEEKKRREEEEKRRKAEKEKADKEKAAKKVNTLKIKLHFSVMKQMIISY